MTDQKPKIFLSYAHEDIGMAKRIYQDLKRYGLDVWIDCESLLPGQNWKITIEKNIKQSQYYLLLLSSHSITKRGFIQKEMKIAYEVLEQCSEDDIYMIPVRLNKCEPSLRISDIHYIDLFPKSEYLNGLKKILQVVSPGTFLLRSKPMELSAVDVNEMIARHGFYEKDRNPGGKGFTHKYELKKINGDKIIFDGISSLMWQQSGSDKYINYENAKKWIKELNRNGFAGFKDWRLPTLEEAMSLMEREKNNDLYIDPIFDSKQRYIWTADQVKSESWMWVVGFYYGYCYGDPFNDEDYVRVVRSGQSSQ